MAWVCPYCAHYSLGACPAGFHILSSRRFKSKPGRTFAREFRRNVIVMVLGWFLPPMVGLYYLIRNFTWPVLGLLVLFCMIGFWLLPEASTPKSIAKAVRRPAARGGLEHERFNNFHS